ncbi:hypothetical protein MMC07_006569 [Pseudocyphellaria aurata]|nr:hypothetical protein [Pseudocyphellaria aurata]
MTTVSHSAQRGILSSATYHTLHQHILPRLDARDLACLAASCTALRQLVMSADPHIWQRAAQAALPWHPILPADNSAVQAALAAHHTCNRNILHGRGTPASRHTCTLPVSVRNVFPGPDGQHYGYTTHTVGSSAVWLLHAASAQHQQLLKEPDSHHISISWQRNTGHLRVLLSRREQLAMCSFDVQGQKQESWTASLAGLRSNMRDSDIFWAENMFMLLVAQLHDGVLVSRLLNGSDSTSVVLAVPDERSAAHLRPTLLRSASFSPDASLVVLYVQTLPCAPEYMLQFYDCHSGLPLVESHADMALAADLISHLILRPGAWPLNSLSWWLPDENAFLVPIMAAGSCAITDLGMLSLLDGICRPLACTLNLGHLSVLRDMFVSPNGRYAAVHLGPTGQRAIVVDVQTGAVAWSEQFDSCWSRSFSSLFEWSPCSQWLAMCRVESDGILQPRLQLVDPVRQTGKPAGYVIDSGLLLGPPQGLENAQRAEWFSLPYDWHLLWTQTGSCLTLSGSLRSGPRSCDSINHVCLLTAAMQF